MHPFDHHYVEDTVETARIFLNSPKPEIREAAMWAIPHLSAAIRYTLGRGGASAAHAPRIPRRLLRAVTLHGIIPIRCGANCAFAAFIGARDDLETLHALLLEYLALAQADELTPPAHPWLGSLDVDGWAKWHVRHTGKVFHLVERA